MVNNILSTENLNLWFGRNYVLKYVNLNVADKNITAVIGPSGCGKSTLLRCFNRMNDLIPETHIEGQIKLLPNFTKLQFFSSEKELFWHISVES